MEEAYKIFCKNMIEESHNSMPAISISFIQDCRTHISLTDEIDKFLYAEGKKNDIGNNRKD